MESGEAVTPTNYRIGGGVPVAWAAQCGQARHGFQADHELESARPVNRDIAGFGSVETLATGPAGATIAIWCCFAAFCACTRTAPTPVPSNRIIGRENYREPTFDASRPCGLHGASPIAPDLTPTSNQPA
jgi:hypothetical protein